MEGTRERSKAERRRRLKEAALAVFAEKGFEGATTREIAERAGVGAATLFRYAEEKRDLLLMIVNDDLTAMNEATLAAIDFEALLIDTLLGLFAPRYAYYAVNPALSREVIHVTVLARADTDTFETQRYRHRRNDLLRAIVDVIRSQQKRGTIRSDYAPAFLAEFLLDIYTAQRRHWLSQPKPDLTAGISALRAMLELAIAGAGANAARRTQSG